MADIKDRIDSIKEYFKGMQVENIEGQQVIYVIVNFPKKWFIVEDLEDKFGIAVEKANKEGGWLFVAEFEVGFDVLFDAIEYNIEIMETAQERANLLQRKIVELKELFDREDVTLEMLRTLDFTWKGKKKPTAGKQKKIEEISEEEGNKEE